MREGQHFKKKKKQFFSSSVHVKGFYKPSYFEKVRGDDDDGAVLSINTQSPAP